MVPGINGPSGLGRHPQCRHHAGRIAALSEGKRVWTKPRTSSSPPITASPPSAMPAPPAPPPISIPQRRWWTCPRLPGDGSGRHVGPAVAGPRRHRRADRFQQWRQTARRLGHAGRSNPSRRGGGRQWRFGPDLSSGHDRQGSWPGQGNGRQYRQFLLTQDYVSGIFVNDKLGKFPGALSMSDVGLMGAARTPQPAIYVNFRTFSTGCENELQCTVAVMDTPLATGQGNHGSFSRAETRNFMAAIGPDFKTGYADPAPISNADIAPTLAHVMGLRASGQRRAQGPGDRRGAGRRRGSPNPAPDRQIRTRTGRRPDHPQSGDGGHLPAISTRPGSRAKRWALRRNKSGRTAPGADAPI